MQEWCARLGYLSLGLPACLYQGPLMGGPQCFLPVPRIKSIRKCPFYWGSQIWNHLPLNIRTTDSKKQYKDFKIKKQYHKDYFSSLNRCVFHLSPHRLYSFHLDNTTTNVFYLLILYYVRFYTTVHSCPAAKSACYLYKLHVYTL